MMMLFLSLMQVKPGRAKMISASLANMTMVIGKTTVGFLVSV